ncbi:MAG: tetratricopeptide repeat protein [Gammaproteobacteria bacterium]|nr:tetratricopeptide repeat protein [Gammaproteobacteria bacterium]
MKRIRNITHVVSQILLLVTLSVLPLMSLSQTSSLVEKENLNSKAKQAFKSGKFHQALNYYQQLDQIFPSYTSRYNLAVCHYKLDNWRQAYKIFSELHKQEPMNEYVHLNLALAAVRLGKTEEALERFMLLADTAESDEIYVLAYKHYLQLSDTKNDATLEQLKNRKWMLSAAFGVGSNDNIIDPADENASAQSDTFSEQTFSASWYSSEDLNRSWLVDASLYSSSYSKVSEYDVDLGGVGVKKYFSLGKNHRLHLGVRFDQSSIDGTGYLQSIYYDLGTRYTFNKLDLLAISISLQESDDRDEIYYGLAGKSYQFSTDYQKYTGSQRWRLRYRFDRDDKNDSETVIDDDGNTSFTSYSADRQSLYGSWSYQSKNWYTQLFVNYRDSQYKDPHIIDSISSLRADQRASVGLQISRQLSEHWTLDFEFSNTDNQSTIDQYEYNQNIAALMLSWQN